MRASRASTTSSSATSWPSTRRIWRPRIAAAICATSTPRPRTCPRRSSTRRSSCSTIGDVSPPVKTEQGVVILKLTGRRKALMRTFDEVKQQIRNQLYRDKRQDSMESFVKSLRDKASVKIDEGKLAKVQIEGAGPGQFRGRACRRRGRGSSIRARRARRRRRRRCRATRRARRASHFRRPVRPRRPSRRSRSRRS